MSAITDFEIENGVLKKYKGKGGDVTVPDGVTSIGGWAFKDCSSLTSVILPDSLKSIGDRAFCDCSSLTSVTIPESVTSIEEGAFSHCESLTSITIPDSVTSIGKDAFYDCKNLTSVTIPDSVTSIGDRAFRWCSSLTSITIPDSVTSIDNEAFSGCSSLRSITIPDGVTSIGKGAFYCCCSLTSITLPDSVTSIGKEAFEDCSRLTSITFPGSVTSIGDNAFSRCESLTSITLPDSVTSIGKEAFSWCKSLTSITIPEGVRSIGNWAFSGCSSLTSVMIPASVTSVGMEAFSGCSSLKKIILLHTTYLLEPYVFGDKLPEMLSLSEGKLYLHLDDLLLKKLLSMEESWKSLSTSEKSELLCLKQSKPFLNVYTERMSPQDAEAIGEVMLRRFSDGGSSKEYTAAANLLLNFSELLSSELMRKLYESMKNVKSAAKAVKSIESDTKLLKKINGAEAAKSLSTAEKIIFAFRSAKGIEVALDKYYSLTMLDLPKIFYADGTLASPTVLAWLLTVHEKRMENKRDQWGEYAYVAVAYEHPGICAEAKEVLSYIDAACLQKALLSLADKHLGLKTGSRKMYLAYPICRYADEDTMNELLKRAPKWRSTVNGNDAPSLAAFRKACLFSEYRGAAIFAERYGDLDRYAAIRGTDADTVRDTMLADFGFDADGTKKYELGDTAIVVSLQKDLTLALFDTKAGKVVKSVPKRGNDEELVALATADFSELKKNVKKVAKIRCDRLFEQFLSGEATDGGKWKTVYLENPLLRSIAELLVWQQGGATFTLQGAAAIDAAGNPYEVTDEAICVAHPIEMEPEIVKTWQNYFTSHSLKQPFAQIWECVIDPASVSETRYDGCTVPITFVRGAGKHGFRYYDEYFHSDIGAELTVPGCRLYMERTQWHRHELLPDETFTLGKFSFSEFTRRVNHIITVLDRWTVYDRIKKDDTSVSAQLGSFTVAQITEFIKLASESEATSCTALLLDYKNRTWPDIDPFAAFTLDLL